MAERRWKRKSFVIAGKSSLFFLEDLPLGTNQRLHEETISQRLVHVRFGVNRTWLGESESWKEWSVVDKDHVTIPCDNSPSINLSEHIFGSVSRRLGRRRDPDVGRNLDLLLSSSTSKGSEG